jgi:ATP-dependent Lhr-like helicase
LQDTRWRAAEDSPRYQAAAAGDPAALESLTRRALRASGPEPSSRIAARAALPLAEVEAALEKLAARGEAVRGHFRPDEANEIPEWIDPGMLDRLQRRSLAAARRSIKPVDAEQYSRFLLSWQHLSPESRLEGVGGLDRALAGLAGISLPADLVERELLARRVRAYQPSWLDRRISDGDWAFSCSGGTSRMRVALWPRAELGPPSPPPPEEDTPSARVIHHLATRGASFFTDLWQATDLDTAALADALWELCASGVVTNDRFDPVRRGRIAIGPDPRAVSRARPAQLRTHGAGGRWSLASTLPIDPTWWAERLLDRYGVVAREHVEAEQPPVVWRELLDLYKSMELRGQVRRGYFVEGFSGAQFAWPAAVEALRADRPRSAVLLSACDPACTVLGLDLTRVASNFVVLDGGKPALLLETAARKLRMLVESPPLDALASLAGIIELDSINDALAHDSSFAAALLALGFERDGERLRRSPLKVKPLG